jgi:hypothetical protein
MVEVHPMGVKDSATVGARPFPDGPQQCDRRCLANAYAPNLALAIPPVIGTVRRTLARTLAHG